MFTRTFLSLSLSLLISDGRSTGENRSTRNITEVVWKVNLNLSLFIASKRGWGKVMFSQVPRPSGGGGVWVSLVPGPFWGAVCLGVGMSGSMSRGRGKYVHQGWNRTPSPDTWDLGYYGIRSTSGRYASFWNAFFLFIAYEWSNL